MRVWYTDGVRWWWWTKQPDGQLSYPLGVQHYPPEGEVVMLDRFPWVKP